MLGFAWVQPPRSGPRANPGHPLGFQCRVDGDSWLACQSPLNLQHLRSGWHTLHLRALNESGRGSPVAVWRWRVPGSRKGPKPGGPSHVAAPLPTGDEAGAAFSIEQIAPPGPLFPGAPAQAPALLLTNPNASPIAVTALETTIAAVPPGCVAENFLLIPSDASPAHPLVIAAESSVALPTQGLSPPAIAMLDLPVSQDACQGAQLELRYSGEAEG
jgi:hypothetical protein